MRPAPPVRPTAAIGALAATLALAACATPPLPGPALAEAPAAQALPPATPLQKRLDAPTLVIAGERLNTEPLRRFYARHAFQPVWSTRPDQASTLLQAVLQARDHGLDPALFHTLPLESSPAGGRRQVEGGGAAGHSEAADRPAPSNKQSPPPDDLSPLDRDILQSAAILAYADALARGAVPIERRRKDEILTPDPIDIPATIDAALATPDPAAALEALAPTTPTYRALRQALKAPPPTARAAKALHATRRRILEVNLERQRWLPRHLPSDRVWVNVADERLVLFRADQPALTTRVVVGEDLQQNQSPEFHTTINASFFNPPWVIPADIATNEILPKLGEDPDYLSRNNMVLLANGEVEQQPGPEAGLGYVMFDMPNKFDVYLHDTPDRDIFARKNRRISHGCIRVQHPRELAALLLDQPLTAIDHGIATGNTTRTKLPTPTPVFVVYQTAFLDEQARLQFRPDFYDRDAAIWQQLQASPR